MPSVKRNSIVAETTAKVTGLIFPCLMLLQPERCFLAKHNAYSALTSALLCVPLFFADSEKVLVWWLRVIVASFHMEIVCIFILATLITELLFKQFLIRTAW